MRSGEPPDAGRRQAGFAYLLLLALVVVIGVAATGAVMLGHHLSRRQAELALLVAGEEFAAALRSYATAGPEAAARPRALQDLLRDPRVAGVRRHLRAIRADPLTGRTEWGLVLDLQGGIVAVHSLAPGTPIKRTGFEASQAWFEDAPSYANWRFSAMPQPPRPQAGATSGR
jgi:type II secretory pathway pseudopilin PulG